MEKTTKTPNSRRSRIYLVRPKLQLRYAVIAVSYAFLGATLVQILSLMKLKSFQLEGSAENAILLAEYVNYMLWVYLGVLLFVGVVAYTYSIFWSHSFAGPLVPIVRRIEEMINGDYKGRVNLRKNDELKEISEALNRLCERLEGER